MPHDRDDKPTSLWKKELSFKRKPREEAPAPDEERPVAPEAGSVWKKELSLRRKSRPEPAEPVASADEPVEAVPVVVPAPIVSAPDEPAPPVDHGWLTQPLEEVSEPP